MRWQWAGLSPLLMLVVLVGCHGYDWKSLQLPEEHMPYFFSNNPDLRLLCQQEDACPYKTALSLDKCWGYEEGCPPDKRMLQANCSGDSNRWASSKEDQMNQFWKSADFGYISERRKEMMVLCIPDTEEDSSLECSDYLRYCRAKNIYLDFRGLSFKRNEKFQQEFLLEGKVGGHCNLEKMPLKRKGEHKSALQSWFAELEHYTSLPFKPLDNVHCDIIIDKPAMFMKLDAGVNMYHHYCDFINFYASQHINNSFSTDIQLIRWDTSGSGYGDLFPETFRAFSEHDIIPLKDFVNKRVCVKDALFPLLPRMRYGLFYNMPLIPGCKDTGLFRAFSSHLVHRLQIPQHDPIEGKIRVTILERKSKYRNIMNQDELLSALKTVGEYDVQLVAFKYRDMPFLDQVEISHNSDIFIGMHGAGLTHMLYQPNWGSVIELFNCGDANCYLDLARLRGVQYFTWENVNKLVQEDEGHHPTLGAHQKFTNYAFNVEEFMRLVGKAADHVRSHPEYIAAVSRRQSKIKDEL